MREQVVHVGGVLRSAERGSPETCRLAEHSFEIVGGERELSGDVAIVLGPPVHAHRGLPEMKRGAVCPDTTSPG